MNNPLPDSSSRIRHRQSESRRERRLVGHDRRRSLVPVRLNDRRSGFDRRRPEGGLISSLRASDAAVLFSLVAINVLNVLDLLLTYRALSLGFTEANPVMSLVLEQGAVGALVKLGIVGASTGIMWRLRRYRPTLVAIVLSATLYSMLVGYHVVMNVRMATGAI